MQRKSGTIRVALIGAGRFGMKRANAVGKSDRSTLTVVADTVTDLAEAAGQRFDCRTTTNWREAVTQENVDVVIVSTPTHISSQVSLVAVQAGKHVLTEKPCAACSAAFVTVVQAARARKVRLKAGYNHRYHPGLRQAHVYFEEGAIGRPLTAQCFYGHGGRIGYGQEWRSRADLSGGGQLLDQGVHALDLFRWFLGDFEEVNAMISTAFWPIAPTEDNVFATMRAASGAVAQLHASWTYWKNKFSFTLIGDKGYLCVEGLGGSYGRERLCLGVRENPGEVPKEKWHEFADRDESLELEWEDFLDSIVEGHEPMSSGDDAWRTLLLVDAIYRAARERRTIHGDEIERGANAAQVQ